MARNKQIEALESAINVPNFTLSEDMLPDILDWEVGKEYKIEIVAEQRSLEFEMFGEDKKEARFRIVSAKGRGLA